MLGRGAPAETGWGENLFDSPLRALIHWRIPYLATCSLFLPPSSHLPLPPFLQSPPPVLSLSLSGLSAFILFHFLYVLRSYETPTAVPRLLLAPPRVLRNKLQGILRRASPTPFLPETEREREGDGTVFAFYAYLRLFRMRVYCGGSMFTSSFSTDFLTFSVPL